MPAPVDKERKAVLDSFRKEDDASCSQLDDVFRTPKTQARNKSYLLNAPLLKIGKPADMTVSSLSDSGSDSLRWAPLPKCRTSLRERLLSGESEGANKVAFDQAVQNAQFEDSKSDKVKGIMARIKAIRDRQFRQLPSGQLTTCNAEATHCPPNSEHVSAKIGNVLSIFAGENKNGHQIQVNDALIDSQKRPFHVNGQTALKNLNSNSVKGLSDCRCQFPGVDQRDEELTLFDIQVDVSEDDDAGRVARLQAMRNRNSRFWPLCEEPDPVTSVSKANADTSFTVKRILPTGKSARRGRKFKFRK